MCMVSNIGTGFTETYPTYPNVQHWIQPHSCEVPRLEFNALREELDRLRKDLTELKKVIEAAKEYDKETGQPECEMEEKVALLKRLGELVGVDLEL